MFPDWNRRGMETTQLGLLASLPRTDGFTVLLYPRLKTAPQPRLTSDLGGKVVKVEHEAGTDYVFLSSTPFSYDQGDIHFAGLAGMIQLRGSEVIVAMGSGGKVSARGKTATSAAPLPKTAKHERPDRGLEDAGNDPRARWCGRGDHLAAGHHVDASHLPPQRGAGDVLRGRYYGGAAVESPFVRCARHARIFVGRIAAG
jgi:hypothetical protein